MAQRVGRGIALLFHDRVTRRGWVVSSTPRSHFTPGKDPVPILQEAGWAPGTVWTGGKSRPHRDSIPDRPARSPVAIPTELPGPQSVYIVLVTLCLHMVNKALSFQIWNASINYKYKNPWITVKKKLKEMIVVYFTVFAWKGCVKSRISMWPAGLRAETRSPGPTDYEAGVPNTRRRRLATFLTQICNYRPKQSNKCGTIRYILFSPVSWSRFHVANRFFPYCKNVSTSSFFLFKLFSV